MVWWMLSLKGHIHCPENQNHISSKVIAENVNSYATDVHAVHLRIKEMFELNLLIPSS